MVDANSDAHFIGWLPMPRAFARYLLPVAIGSVIGLAIVAVVIAAGQRSPGNSRWNDQTVSFEGIVYAEPYAMICLPGEHESKPVSAVLLVEEGKYGAKKRIRPFEGMTVRVTGTLLQRDGIRMLELANDENGVTLIASTTERTTSLQRKPPTQTEQVEITGEIVDSKCYLGAMKPGGGFTHKACAILCLRGGIPPLFVSRDADDHPIYFLLTNPDGQPLDSNSQVKRFELKRNVGSGQTLTCWL